MDGRKHRVKSLRPRYINSALSEHTYEVQEMINENHALIHANHLNLYVY